MLFHKRAIFETKIKVIEFRICFDFLYNFCLNHFSFSEELSEINMCIVLRVKYRYSCLILMKLQFPQQIFEEKVFKYPV